MRPLRLSAGKVSEFLRNQSDRIVLVYFQAPLSEVCRSLASWWNKLPAKHPSVSFCEIDIFQSVQENERYNVRQYPVFIFFQSGLELARVEGPDKNRVSAMLHKKFPAPAKKAPERHDNRGSVLLGMGFPREIVDQVLRNVSPTASIDDCVLYLEKKQNARVAPEETTTFSILVSQGYDRLLVLRAMEKIGVNSLHDLIELMNTFVHSEKSDFPSEQMEPRPVSSAKTSHCVLCLVFQNGKSVIEKFDGRCSLNDVV
jgi:thiol-disulfide isomerase/thioredoxin